MSENTFNQTNHSGAIGTQGQTGDNHQTNNMGADGEKLIEALRRELKLVPHAWPKDVDDKVTEEFESPAEMVKKSLEIAGQDLGNEAREFEVEEESNWYDRFKQLLPLGIKIASSSTIALLSAYTPASPILAAIAKTLVDEYNNE